MHPRSHSIRNETCCNAALRTLQFGRPSLPHSIPPSSIHPSSHTSVPVVNVLVGEPPASRLSPGLCRHCPVHLIKRRGRRDREQVVGEMRKAISLECDEGCSWMGASKAIHPVPLPICPLAVRVPATGALVQTGMYGTCMSQGYTSGNERTDEWAAGSQRKKNPPPSRLPLSPCLPGCTQAHRPVGELS